VAEGAAIAASVFKAGHGAGEDWGSAVKACMNSLEAPPEGANLGLLYATDALADDLSSVLTFLRERTGIEHWVGNIGFGVAASGVEYHDRPALAVLTAALPEAAFRILAPVSNQAGADAIAAFAEQQAGWLAQHQGLFGVVHGDPRHHNIAEIVAQAAARSSGFLVGGLTASRGGHHQIAERVTEAGLSGVLFAPEVPVAVGLTQGCSLIGAARTITEVESAGAGGAEGGGDVIAAIDGRPALEVFKEDIGELLAHDLRRVGGYIFAAFPIADSDTGDYLVRNLTGIDPNQGWISVAEPVEAGRRIQFCRRDHDAALSDLKRMVRDVKARAGAAPKAGLYFSCIARGPSLFSSESEELRLIEAELGAIPLAGFFGNGEIFNNRLYTHTGVLVLFV
jgi:small ligand-binding sensory domain FIST